MAKRKETILVTGITGQQGGAVARQLLKEGYPIVGLSRDPGKAGEFTRQGVKIVQGDLTDRASLDRAFEGVRKAFLVTTPFEHGTEYETEQGIKFVDACTIAGVNQLVYSSVASAQRNTGIPHFDSKWKVEEHLRRVGVPHTIIRPVFFYENLTAPWMLPALRAGRISLPVRADRPLQMIAVSDVARFVVAAFDKPDVYLSKGLDIAGDDLTFPAVAQIVSELAGQEIVYSPMPESEAEKNFGQDFALMFKWFNAVGYDVDIPALEKQHKIKLIRFKDWIKDSGLVNELRQEAEDLKR